MRIRDILRKKGTEVFTVAPDESVTQLVDVLNQRRIGALVVVDADGDVIGIVTERDVLRNWSRCVASTSEDTLQVADIMTRDLIIGVPGDEIQYAMGVMTRERVRHLPVLEDKKLAGIISIGDVVKAQMEETAFENRMLQDYIRRT